MKANRSLLSALVLATVALLAGASRSPRQYYGTTWTYSPSYSYYYLYYYYRPVVSYETYDYHYCIYYPTQPGYIYYYNPTSQVYWGRYKVGSSGDERYSLLAKADRKKDLKDIPESAFPKPGKMPTIPDSEDGAAIEPPPEDDLPKAEK
jgi:hypothetical protein